MRMSGGLCSVFFSPPTPPPPILSTYSYSSCSALLRHPSFDTLRRLPAGTSREADGYGSEERRGRAGKASIVDSSVVGDGDKRREGTDLERAGKLRGKEMAKSCATASIDNAARKGIPAPESPCSQLAVCASPAPSPPPRACPSASGSLIGVRSALTLRTAG
ncbi:hypothetical protein C8R45DRAFT_1110178 [Mycena sanguinolenta]|nr:hypothetical protein C8R45DRAFT_1110178 [Mycena sanguinolenta]